MNRRHFLTPARESTRPHPILKAIAIGLLAGIVGSVAKIAGEAVYPPRTQGQTPPPVVLAERLAGHPFPHGEQLAVMNAIHFTFGALTGAVYAAAAEVAPIVTLGYGSVFGIVLQILTHETLVPAAHLDVPASRQPAREHLSEFFSHILYGVATEATRRLLRKRL